VRYFFTIHNHQTYRDDSGYSFAGPKEAIAYAEVIARELGRKNDLAGSRLVVTDEQGRVVKELTINVDEPAHSFAKRD
jgi:hypothetical protein